MSDEETTEKTSGAMKALIALVAVVALGLAVIIGMMLTGKSETAQPPTPTPSSATPTPFIEDDLNVTAGEGGTKKSPIDGKTSVGYEHSCKGAVQAATNYQRDLDSARVLSGEITPEVFIKLLADRTTGKFGETFTTGNRDILKEVKTRDAEPRTFKPEWGGFTVIDCNDEEAIIGIVDARSDNGKEYSYAAGSVHLKWVDGDWKVTALQPQETPTDLPAEPVTAPDPKVLQDLGLHDQWENYENAPQ